MIFDRAQANVAKKIEKSQTSPAFLKIMKDSVPNAFALLNGIPSFITEITGYEPEVKYQRQRDLIYALRSSKII